MPTIETTNALTGLTPEIGQGSLNDPAIFAQGLNDARSERFDSALRRALGGDQRTTETPRQAAQEFIAIALVQPVLAQLRETNQAAAPFAPGDVEKRFGPLLDAEIAHRMVRSSGWGLVDAVESRLTQRLAEPQPRGLNTNA
ncbi:MAG: hypothetical protein H6813_05785 [Phycisphaeraceae bacterium]|nr:hypothetical protein [Phycisphaeraceae bacterium]MCB9847979.1 hypothetical protein [Phycisphaeraceae bacterium]